MALRARRACCAGLPIADLAGAPCTAYALLFRSITDSAGKVAVRLGAGMAPACTSAPAHQPRSVTTACPVLAGRRGGRRM